MKKKSDEKLIRVFDVISSLVGLIILSPLLLIIYVLVLAESGIPAFFSQCRVGLEGKEFKIYKFRTMKPNKGALITIGDDDRITKVGRVLRKFKLDELPQLFNVLKGDMSLVGPRPEVKKYVNYYNEKQRKVLSVKPGITDYASIKYRKESEILRNSENPEKDYIDKIMPDKISINLEYLEKRNLKQNIKVIFLTLYTIIKR